jgi:hypothetical protein
MSSEDISMNLGEPCRIQNLFEKKMCEESEKLVFVVTAVYLVLGNGFCYLFGSTEALSAHL